MLPPDLNDLRSLGWVVADWCERWLAQPDGDRAGQSFRFTDDQLTFLARWYAVDDQGRWLHRRAQYVRAKGTGKALALDTPLPTPTGWTTMGTVAPGDLLLDEHGLPTTVVAVTDVMHGHDCYRVIFRDGTSIVADADHLWPVDVFTGRSVRQRMTLTTRQIVDAGVRFERVLTTGRTKCSTGVSRYRTLPTPPMDGPDVDFPIPPYLLGYWLGDGDSDYPRVTIHRDDIGSFEAELDSLGIEHGEPRRTHGETYRIRFGRGWARVALREAGLLHNKHIPPTLMRGGYKQRLALLQGLMDSDGTADSRGRIEFCVTSRQLAADVVELIRTLGLYPRMAASPAVLNGRVVGTRYRVSVTAYSDEPIFRLPRKADRLIPRPGQLPYSASRTISSVDQVESVPVRCVSVSGESHLYLAGEGLIPTHNSPLVAAVGCAELGGPVVFDGWDADGQPVGRPHPSPWVQLAATSEDQTTNTMSLVLAMLREGDAAEEIPGLDLGLTRIYTARGRLEPVTASAPSREGQRTTACVLDETHHWLSANGGHRLAATIRRNLAKMGGRSIETTNAWRPGDDSVAERTADYAAKIAAGLVRDDGLLYDHVQAPPETDIRDEQSLRRGLVVAYRDATWVDLDRIQAEFYDTGNDVADLRRFYLNQIIAAEDAWVVPHEWDACGDVDLTLHDGDEITLGFDGSRTDDATALVACRVDDGALFLLHVQAAPPDARRTGWEVDRERVDDAVRAAFDRFSVAGFFSDVHPWESYVDSWSRDFGSGLRVKASERSAVGFDMRSKTQLFTRAAEAFAQAVADGEVRHDGNGVLREHVHNARRRPNRFGVGFGKEHRESLRKVDAAVAAVLARAAWQEVSRKAKPRNVGARAVGF